MSDETKKLFSVNFNSLLMVVLLGVVGWMATETRNNSLSLASVKTAQDLTGKSNTDALQRLEAKVDKGVSKTEYDSRIVAVESRLVELAVRMREVDLAVLKLQAAAGASSQRQP